MKDWRIHVMTQDFFKQFPDLWDAFEIQIQKQYDQLMKKHFLTEPSVEKRELSNLYHSVAAKYWYAGSKKASDWLCQLKKMAFENEFSIIVNLLIFNDSLDVLLTEHKLFFLRKIGSYDRIFHPLMIKRKQEIIKKLADVEKSINQTWDYDLPLQMNEETVEYRLKFRSYNKKESGMEGLNGYTYDFHGRKYQDVKSLWIKTLEELSKDTFIGLDIYGNQVLQHFTSIPTFDSGDREWDSEKVEYLFFDGTDINMVILRGGYRIAKLIFYTRLLNADERLKPLFIKLGWPVEQIDWNKEIMNHEQRLQMVYQKAAECMIKEIEEKMPENGSFQKIFVTECYDKSDLRGMLCAETSYQGENIRKIFVGAFREGDDRLVKNYLFTGTKQEILAWLTQPESVKEMIKCYRNLEKTVKSWR